MFQTLKLDHCWICKSKFGQELIANEHHIVPRAYGGRDGPQISLCAGHHDRMHFVALRLIGNKSYHDLMTSDVDTNSRMLQLASVIQRAEAAFSKDPNKKILVSFSTTLSINRKLLELSKLHKLSKENYLQHLIEREHKKILG